MGAGNQARPQPASPLVEESLEFLQLDRRQSREPWQWRPPMAVEGRRETPDATFAVAKFALLFRTVLV